MSAQKPKVNINLVVREAPTSFSEQFLAWALTYGRYIIILTQITVLIVFFLRFKLDRDHTDLKESVSQKQAIVESVADLETDIRRVQGKLADIRTTSENQNLYSKVLHFLQENTPVDTYYTTVSLSGDRITFAATASNLRSFSYLLQQLQKENKFSEVTLEDILRRTDGKIEYKVKAKINQKFFQ